MIFKSVTDLVAPSEPRPSIQGTFLQEIRAYYRGQVGVAVRNGESDGKSIKVGLCRSL